MAKTFHHFVFVSPFCTRFFLVISSQKKKKKISFLGCVKVIESDCILILYLGLGPMCGRELVFTSTHVRTSETCVAFFFLNGDTHTDVLNPPATLSESF
jgi:hypothetical protein